MNKNNQICNFDEIEALTGYRPGNLFLCGRDGTISTLDKWNDILYTPQNDTRSVYDIESGNFHIVPDPRIHPELCDTAASLITSFGKKLKSISDIKLTGPRLIMISDAPYQPLKIETVLTHRNNGFKYHLCFDRIYTDESVKTVNCRLGAFQFMRQKETSMSVNKVISKTNKTFLMCYPPSADDGASSSVKWRGYRGRPDYRTIVENPVGLPSLFELDRYTDEDFQMILKAFKKFISSNPT